MQADRQDRVRRSESPRKQGPQAMVMIIVALILAAGAYLLLPGDEEPAPQPAQESAPEARPQPEPPRPDPAANIAAAPDIPEPVVVAEPTPEPEPVAEPEPVPPTPEELDAQLRAKLEDSGLTAPPELSTAVSTPFLLDRSVSAIDQVARGYVPLRALNLQRPAGKFSVRQEAQRRYIDERSYDRYDGLVDAVTSLSPDALAAAFQGSRTLLADAYAGLGYPADAVDTATIAALDVILATPVVRGSIEVTSKGALWAYADADLEARSDMEKQLMRLGPDNLETLQRWARDIRSALLQ